MWQVRLSKYYLCLKKDQPQSRISPKIEESHGRYMNIDDSSWKLQFSRAIGTLDDMATLGS
jgi:hypothetical protein